MVHYRQSEVEKITAVEKNLYQNKFRYEKKEIREIFGKIDEIDKKNIWYKRLLIILCLIGVSFIFLSYSISLIFFILSIVNFV